MKKIVFVGSLLLSAMVQAQNGQVIVGNYATQYVFSAPSGTCSQNALQQNVMGVGTVYTCQNGTWAQVGGGGGAVSSVFGRSGAVVAVSGDYTVAQVTGAAPLASPTFTTPTLGVATATSINKMTITAPATGSTLAVADGKTATISNTLTFTGTDASSVAFGAGGTVAYTANNLSAFAATTSAQFLGVLSDETGTGVAVFGTAPTISGLNSTGQMLLPASVSCTTPSIGITSTTNSGITSPNANQIVFCGSGLIQLGIAGTGAILTNNKSYGWSNSSGGISTKEMDIVREDKGVICSQLASGSCDGWWGASQGIKTIKGANGTANSTTTPAIVTDGTTPWTFTFPATTTARTYTYKCDLVYQASATTTSLVLGVVSSVSTGANTLLTEARITSAITAGSETYTIATPTNNTPTGGTSITVLTGALAGTANSNLPAKIWGTIEETTAGGTLSIQISASPSGTVTPMRGSNCNAWAN